MMGEDQLQRHIERVLGRDDKPEDWRALHAAAEAAPTTWKRLLRDLEDDCELREAVRARLPVEDIDLPGEGPAAFVRRGGSWAGWMVAACAVFLWMVEAPGPFGRGVDPSDPAGGLTARDGGSAQVAGPQQFAGSQVAGSQVGGSFEGELPELVLASEPAGDGSYDVVVLRREIVRKRMPLAETVHRDDSGQPFAVPVSHQPQVPVRSY